MNDPAVLRDMLGLTPTPPPAPPHIPRTLAVVGLSDDPTRPSYTVSAAMQRAGFRILPVNPGIDSVLGERSYPSLQALPFRPDVVNVFRLPRFLPALVDDMIALGLRDLWVQSGILHPGAAHTAEQAGLRVVMDRCILVEYRRLLAIDGLQNAS